MDGRVSEHRTQTGAIQSPFLYNNSKTRDGIKIFQVVELQPTHYMTSTVLVYKALNHARLVFTAISTRLWAMLLYVEK